MAQTRERQLADAFLSVARVNHYMVGIVEPFTADELDEAEQVLIGAQNALHPDEMEWQHHELALDLVEHARKRKRDAA